MIGNRWWLTQISPLLPHPSPRSAGSWTLTVPQVHLSGSLLTRFFSPAGGRGRLRGRRGRQDAVQRERPRRRQRAQLPGAHGGRRGRFHFARGRTDHVEEHNGHETVQPALRHHVSRLPEALLLLWQLLSKCRLVRKTFCDPYSLALDFWVSPPLLLYGIFFSHCTIPETDFRFFFFGLSFLLQAGTGGAAPGGPRGEEATPQEPERVWGAVLQTKRKVKTMFGNLPKLLFHEKHAEFVAE